MDDFCTIKSNKNDDENYIPWVEKYRPRKLDDITQDINIINLFKKCISTGNITHFIFYGMPGTGKTSAILAIGREIFKEYFVTRVIEFNASDDRGINAVREKITNEARKYVTSAVSSDGSIIPPYKIIILDEADSMTDEAQDALRVIIEEHSGVTRFCFICNYISKITDAIKSRCSSVYFKRISKECMINKLKEVAKKESLEITDKIFDTLIDISNGDMRKAILLMQNFKYLYDFKNNIKKPIIQMNPKELKSIYNIYLNKDINAEIIESDIYEIAAIIDMKKANIIINDTLKCKNIVEISNLSKRIIAMGYPVDNILLQLNKAILKNKDLTDEHKARIIKYSGQILFRMKECANEYIQLLDYLSSINGIIKGNTAYDE